MFQCENHNNNKKQEGKETDNNVVYVDSAYNGNNVYVEKQIHSLETHMLLKFVTDRAFWY